MRVPLSWLSEHVDVDLSVDALAHLLTMGGFNVEAIHRPSAEVRGVRVAEVRSVERVAGSDKLYLVEATDGEQTEQVVCGAANYAPGDRVPWAQPEARLPGGVDVGRKKLFGVVSNGMLASARELGVGDDHRGIWVLERDAPLGADLSAWLDLDDPVLELEVTPDRGYGLSILGLARDVAALTGATLRLPEPVAADGRDTGVPVSIEDPERCARFDARRVNGLRPGPSPAWLQRRLFAAGMRPISAIVDATNHAMLETGHPVHAYDLARLAGPRIDVRRARPSETLVTLDGVERHLDPDDLVIADADGPVGLAGVMGGARTEVGQETASVLLEVASFEATGIARSARRHRLHSEASSRFERRVPAGTVPLGATRCAELVTRVAGGSCVGAIDTYPQPVEPLVVRLRPERARRWLGMDVDDERQQALLEALGCVVEPGEADTLAVRVPDYRPDLCEEADLYEEIARLHGYDKVPETVPGTGQVGGRAPEDEARLAVRRALAGAGWSEVLAMPFIGHDDLEVLGLPGDDRRRRPVELVNPLSKEEAVLRTTLLPSLLKILRHNVNRQTADVAVFEVGHAYLPPTTDEPGAPGGPGEVRLPAEPLLLGFAACGAFPPPRYDAAARPVDLYDLTGAVVAAARSVGRVVDVQGVAGESPYHPGRTARIVLDGAEIGLVGELHPRVCQALELPARTLAGELRLDRLVAGGIRPATSNVPSPLPGIRFDVAVVVDEPVPAAAVAAAVRAGAGSGCGSCLLFDVFRGPQLGDGRKSLAYRVRLDDPQRQLTDADEAAAINRIEDAVREIGGELRR